MTDLKSQIKSFINNKYNGSLRFMKDKMFTKTFGNAVYQEILQHNHFLEQSQPFSVRIYNYLNDIKQRPVCKMCKNEVVFNSNKGWLTYCSNECRFNDMQTIQVKKRNTNLHKYGATNVLASDYGKSKSTQTHLQKYGKIHYNQTPEYAERIRSGDIKQNLNPQLAARTICKNFYDSLPIRVPKLIPLFDFDEYFEHKASTYYNYKWQCKECNHIFERWINMGITPLCPICSPKGTQHEIEIKEFLHKHNIEFSFRNRSILNNGLEIDIFIPSRRLGIEIDGLFYHHEDRVDKNFHLNKTIQAESKGIRLIHIFGDEMIRKPRIVFTRLKSILGLVKRKIYARNCTVREIDYAAKSKFLNKYHIQGTSNGTVGLGLYYNNRLVAVMDMCPKRKGIGKSDKEYYELLRYATVSSFTIVGGLGKLVAHFKSMNICNCIISYADRRWSQGNAYAKCGFKLASTSRPNYWYTRNFTERLHRLQFQHKYIKDKLSNYSEELTENENMKNNNFFRVWDCGTLRYELEW